ncbi:cation diffusion facilitator family transporter [Fibrella forsythiae]|uniref:Cation transporter n=1 Tax=Fibrella forsythiae TaxID=2817061 RepID=A0ABS3JQF3_9BACT|nr:cation diffusion facilitator family transporter [Fibrella forsythiae]MBO0952240.1 cation transporter [Fibrella forsythiae]
MHNHAHDHSHAHSPTVTTITRTLIIGAALNIVYVLVEFVMGLQTKSLALVADAGHNLSDVAGILLSLLSFRLAKVKSNQRFTYGLRKSTVLASLVNAVLLLLAVGGILLESTQRFRHPEPVAGGVVAWVAGIGIVVNAASAFLFFRDKDHDLNMKGAYLHLLADALVSVAVVVSGLLIGYTGWFWLDPAMGIVVAAIILVGTWGLLSDSLRLSLDGVPVGIDLAEVQKIVGAVPGVVAVDHVHIWAMSTTENALTAHLTVKPDLTNNQVVLVKKEVRHELEHLGIEHATLEVNAGATGPEPDSH